MTEPTAIQQVLAQSDAPDVVLTVLMETLGDVLRCDRCFLYVRDPVTQRGRITHCWSRDGQSAQWIGADWIEDPNGSPDPLMTLALQTSIAVYVDDIKTAGPNVVNREYEETVFQHRALVHAPIYQHDALIGILECSVLNSPRIWSDCDQQCISALQTALVPLVAPYSQCLSACQCD